MPETRPLPHRPQVARKARLRWDHRESRYLLLYPERALALSPTAAEIVRLCSGRLTIAEIIERLLQTFAGEPATVAADVRGLLQRLLDRGLLNEAQETAGNG
jgi:pyrroloquinoline quinone biosynthesis protein D